MSGPEPALSASEAAYRARMVARCAATAAWVDAACAAFLRMRTGDFAAWLRVNPPPSIGDPPGH